VPEPSYRIAGGGKETVTKTEIRNQIRRGEITANTELAREGSEEYHAASTFPELARYFSLAAPPPAQRAQSSVPRTSVLSRVGPGLIYPFTGIGWVVLVAAMLLPTLPFGRIVAWIFTSVYGLAIIRRSAEGSTVMPKLTDVGGPVKFILSLLKLLLLTLVSAWPVILAIPLMFILRSNLIPWLAALVMILYYPAALATLAKWNTVSLALSVSRIYQFISVLGADYVVALISPILAALLAAAATLVASKFLGPYGRAVAQGLFSTWAGFYFFHLLGWGIHHHEEEF
jgi:hypothetical protein